MTELENGEKKRSNYDKSKLYPAYTLNESIELIEKIKDMPLKSPVSYDILAKRFGLTSVSTKSLKYRISSAKQFGLITTSGNAVKITEVGKKILFPQDNKETIQLKKHCFQEPVLYQNLIKIFLNKALPNQNTLENLLLRDHGISQSSKAVAAKVFLETINELDLAPTGVLTLEEDEINNSTSISNNEQYLGEMLNGDTPSQSFHNENISTLEQATCNDYEQLVIPLGNKRKAIINMPSDTDPDEAEYVKDMLAIMFKKLYGIKI